MENKKNTIVKTIIWVSLFSIAMGFLETAVVIYLRELYYPEGFDFPLVIIDDHIIITEILREAATVIMLLGIGILVGRSASERFAYFIYSFAIWDIFYYIFLKILINWPESIMTWDVLFLIPLTWTGPVITPIIISITMIFFSAAIIYFSQKLAKVTITFYEWSMLIFGTLILIVAFVWDYCRYVLEFFSFSEIWSEPLKEEVIKIAMQYIPKSFNWWLFWIAEIIILTGIGLFIRRNFIMSNKE